MRPGSDATRRCGAARLPAWLWQRAGLARDCSLSARLGNSISWTTVSSVPPGSVDTRKRRVDPISAFMCAATFLNSAASSPPLPNWAWNTERTTIVLPLRNARTAWAGMPTLSKTASMRWPPCGDKKPHPGSGAPATAGFLGVVPGEERVDEDEAGGPLRVGRGEQDARRDGIDGREDHRSLGPGRVHHRDQVVHLDLERRNVARREPVGAPPAAPVGADDPGPLAQPAPEAGEVLALPVEIDVGGIALQVDEVHRARAKDLVGERDVAVPGVPRLGSSGHARAPVQADRKRPWSWPLGAATGGPRRQSTECSTGDSASRVLRSRPDVPARLARVLARPTGRRPIYRDGPSSSAPLGRGEGSVKIGRAS